MGNGVFSRRDFLKFSSALAGGVWLSPRLLGTDHNSNLPVGWGRVTTTQIYVYSEPNFESERVGYRSRDQLLTIFEEIISPHGPDHNPLWYRVKGGFVHASRIQRVEPRPENEVLEKIPEGGILAEVTVPYTRSYRYTHSYGWMRLYRLYYSSTHWIVGLDEGPDGTPWYRLLDHYVNVEYSVPAHTLRPIPYAEYSPISTDFPSKEKRIVVSISDQTLTAYEGDRAVLQTNISSGLPSDPEKLPPGEIPTDTPVGSFYVQNKMPSRHMGDGNLTDDLEAYELPGVPWTGLFHFTGAGFHGTYWHDNFGRRMSHGCVNMRTEEAKWLFRWTDPVYVPKKYYKVERGTVITVYP